MVRGSSCAGLAEGLVRTSTVASTFGAALVATCLRTCCLRGRGARFAVMRALAPAVVLVPVAMSYASFGVRARARLGERGFDAAARSCLRAVVCAVVRFV